jgi:ABC-type nickel/cobalt efflux system permease component RcnA
MSALPLICLLPALRGEERSSSSALQPETRSSPCPYGERLGEGQRRGLLIILFLLLALPALAQPQNPFSLGGLEGAGGAPGNAFAAWILAKQAEFTRAMTIAARGLRNDASAVWGLMGLGFAYGVFHAAGPGHGKAIVASYVVANENALRRGAVIAALAAALQGIVAVALIGAVALVFGGTRRMVTAAVTWVEMLSYLGILVFGLWLLWKKLRGLYALWRGDGAAARHDHFHMPGPKEVMAWSRRDAAAAVVAAGLRPCSGAILILAFTLSQGAFWAGAAAVAAMSAGTALTTAGIATLSVYFKALAVRFASGRGSAALWVARGLEVLAALAVTLLGLALLTGYWASLGGA